MAYIIDYYENVDVHLDLWKFTKIISVGLILRGYRSEFPFIFQQNHTDVTFALMVALKKNDDGYYIDTSQTWTIICLNKFDSSDVRKDSWHTVILFTFIDTVYRLNKQTCFPFIIFNHAFVLRTH